MRAPPIPALSHAQSAMNRSSRVSARLAVLYELRAELETEILSTGFTRFHG